MRKLASRRASVAALAAATILAGGHVEAVPIAAPHAVHADGLAVIEPAQFIHLDKPYCWYPYGWAGAGWYWCNGWNGWVVPRSYRTARLAPGYRFRRYR